MKNNYLITALAVISVTTSITAQENRSYDGTANNLAHPEWGAADTYFRTFTTVDYTDGISQ